MVNLIGLAVGATLARQADIPADERTRIALLGAASPSPLLGAVLVSSALGRTGFETGSGLSRGSLFGTAGRRRDERELARDRREQDRERQQRVDREQEEQLREGLEGLERQRKGRERDELFDDVGAALTEVHRALAEQRRTPDLREAFGEFQEAVMRLTQAVEGHDRDSDGSPDGHRGAEEPKRRRSHG
jgi:hypothetical protein